MARHVEYRFFESQCLVIYSPGRAEETVALYRRASQPAAKTAVLVPCNGLRLRILKLLTSSDEPFLKGQLIKAAKYKGYDPEVYLRRAISDLRKDLGDRAKRPKESRFIETRNRLGYLFRLPVERLKDGEGVRLWKERFGQLPGFLSEFESDDEADPDGGSDPTTRLTALRDLPYPDDAQHVQQLLDPQFRAIPFIGRESDEDSLWEWLNSKTPLSFQMIIGEGGTGKTRLAYRLLELIDHRQLKGWSAGEIAAPTLAAALRSEDFRLLVARDKVLVIIDDASMSEGVLINDVILTPQMRSANRHLRFLLLERGTMEGGGWYQRLCDAAGTSKSVLFPNPPLRPKELTISDRNAILDGALDVLSRYTKQPRLDIHSASRAALDAEAMSNPLTIFMAAMNAHMLRDATPLAWKPAELADAIAGRERHRIRQIADSKLQSQRLLLHMAAYITLTRHLSWNELVSACAQEAMEIEPRAQGSAIELAHLIEDRVLPTADVRSSAAPITPEVVGWAFVTSVLGDRHTEGAATILRALRVKPASVARSLFRFPNKWQEQVLREVKVYPETRALMRLQIDAETDATLRPQLAYNQYVRAGLLNEAREVDEAARLFEEALRTYRSAGNAELGIYFFGFAKLLLMQAVRLHNEGLHSDALTIIEETVALYDDSASRYAPGSRHGRWKSLEEMIDYRRRNSNTLDPEYFIPDVANLFDFRGLVQRALNQTQDAHSSFAAAVEQHRIALHYPTWNSAYGLARGLWFMADLELTRGQAPAALRLFAEVSAYFFEFARILPRVFLEYWIYLQRVMNQVSAGSATANIAPEPSSDDYLAELHRIRNVLAGDPAARFDIVQGTGTSEEVEIVGEVPWMQLFSDPLEGYAVMDLGGTFPLGAPATGNPGLRLPALFAQRRSVAAPPRKSETHARPSSNSNAPRLKPWFQIWVEEIRRRHGDTHDLALYLIEASVQHCRIVARQDPDLYLPALAHWLGQKAEWASEMGRPELAFNCTMEAVTAYVTAVTYARAQSMTRSKQVLAANGFIEKELRQLSAKVNEMFAALQHEAQHDRARVLPDFTLVLLNYTTIARLVGAPQDTLRLLRVVVPNCFELLSTDRKYLSWFRPLSNVLKHVYQLLTAPNCQAGPVDVAWLSVTRARVSHALGENGEVAGEIELAVQHYLRADESSLDHGDLEWMRRTVQNMISAADCEPNEHALESLSLLASMMSAKAAVELLSGNDAAAITAFEDSAHHWRRLAATQPDAAAFAAVQSSEAGTLCLGSDEPRDRNPTRAAQNLMQCIESLREARQNGSAQVISGCESAETFCFAPDTRDRYIEACSASGESPDPALLKLLASGAPTSARDAAHSSD